jgi:tetratricopeptide (TPR) repeat protein
VFEFVRFGKPLVCRRKNYSDGMKLHIFNSAAHFRSPGSLRVHLAVALLALAFVSCAQTPADASADMARGNRAMQAADFAGAIVAFTQVTHDLPSSAEGYFNLGLALQQSGDLTAADEALKKASALKPTLRGANLFRGIIAYRQNRLKDAQLLLEKETRLNPRDAKAFMWLGICRLALDDPHSAIEPLETAHALDPANVDILYHRGRAYLEMANQSYAAMYKVDRDSARVHQVLAEAYASGFRNQEAIGEYEIAVKMAPRQPGLHEDLADQYWIVGQTDKAAEDYRQELQIDPYAASAMYKLGSLLVQHDKADEGVQALVSALKTDPGLSDAHYYLGSGLVALDRNDDAVHEFQLAIAADPKADRAMSSWYKLAQVYRRLHREHEAKAALDHFQQMRAAVKARQDSRTAQIVRNRSQLPVPDPEETAEQAKQ